MTPNLLIPNVYSKIVVVKKNVNSGKITGRIDGHNTILRVALKRLTGIWYQSSGSISSGNLPKILTCFGELTEEQNLSKMYVGLMKSSEFKESENVSVLFTDTETNDIGVNAQTVTRINYNGTWLYENVDFEFVSPSYVKWLKEPCANGYPLPGQTATVYYCPHFFTMESNLQPTTYFFEDQHPNQYQLYKDDDYIWRLDMQATFAPPGTARDIYGVSLYWNSYSYRATLSHLEFIQDHDELLEVYYSIYVDYSESLSVGNGILFPYPVRERMLEVLTKDAFFYNRYYYSSNVPTWGMGCRNYDDTTGARQYRGESKKSIISLSRPGGCTEILRETRGAHCYDKWGTYFKDKTENDSYVYGDGNKIVGGAIGFSSSRSSYCFAKSFSYLSMANLVDNYNPVSRAFLHSVNYSYPTTDVKHLQYPTFETADVGIASTGMIELKKKINYDGDSLEQYGFDCIPWIYFVKFTVTGNQNTAQYQLYKAPIRYVKPKDIGTSLLKLLSDQAIWSNGESFKFNFGHEGYGYYGTQNPFSYLYYEGYAMGHSFHYDPDTSPYGFATLRLDFSDADENGFYACAVHDGEFQIKNVNCIGGITTFLKTNRQRISNYKITEEIDPGGYEQTFTSVKDFHGCILVMDSESNEVPTSMNIQRRRAAENEDWTDVVNQSITDFTGMLNEDFSYFKYHTSPLITWDSSVGGDQWRIQGQTEGCVYFLTEDDILMLQEDGGVGRDWLEYANTCYGVVKGVDEKYFYFATLRGLLRMEVPTCTGQEAIDKLNLSSTFFDVNNNFNLNPAQPRISMIFPHVDDGKIYVLYHNGLLYVFDELLETFTPESTSGPPWNSSNLVPSEEMTLFEDHSFDRGSYYRFFCFNFSFSRFIHSAHKAAAWLNADGDIITYVRGTHTRIPKVANVDYIDFAFDDNNQEYLVAMRSETQTVNDALDSNNIKYYQHKYDVYNLTTTAKPIANKWIDTGTSLHGGRRTFANIFYDTTNSKHYVITSLGTGLCFKQHSIWDSYYQIPNHDFQYKNEDILSLPSCEDAGSSTDVTVTGKQLAGNLKWFTLNGETFSTFTDQIEMFFGAGPAVKQYGWDGSTDEWVLDGLGSKDCSSSWCDLIDNLQIRFDKKPDTAAGEFVLGETVTFLRYKNGIFKDNLQDLTNLSSYLYLGKLVKVCDNDTYVASPSMTFPGTTVWHTNTVIEDSQMDLRVVPPYSYDISSDDATFDYDPEWIGMKTVVSGGSVLTTEAYFGSNPYTGGSSVNILVTVPDLNVITYDDICDTLGEYKTFRISNPPSSGAKGPRYVYTSNIWPPQMTYISGTEYTVEIFCGYVVPWPAGMESLETIVDMDQNMRTFTLMPPTAGEVPYIDPSKATIVSDFVATVGPSEYFIREPYFIGLVNNHIAVCENDVTDSYRLNQKVEFREASGSVRSLTTSAAAAEYGTWSNLTFVTVDGNILDSSECPTEDFRTDANTAAYYATLSACDVKVYSFEQVAEYFYYDEADDWVGQTASNQFRVEEDGHYETGNIFIDVQFDSTNNLTEITMEHKPIFVLPGNRTSEFSEGANIQVSIISKRFRRQFTLIGVKIESLTFDGSDTHIIVDTNKFSISGWQADNFEIGETALFRMYEKSYLWDIGVDLSTTSYDESTDTTTITTSATMAGLTPTNFVFPIPHKPFAIKTIENTTFVMKYDMHYRDENMSAKGTLEVDIGDGQTRITLDKNCLLNAVFTLSGSPGEMEYIRYGDPGATPGFKLYYTGSNPPTDLEHYHIPEGSGTLKLNAGNEGSLLYAKQVYMTYFK